MVVAGLIKTAQCAAAVGWREILIGNIRFTPY